MVPSHLVLRKILTELLNKNFIRISSSPIAAPILFVKKPGGGIHFYIDYQALNEITRKDHYLLPLIQETLRNLSKARWLTKFDINQAFYQVYIAKGEEWKIIFRMRYGLYEW